MLYYLNRSSNSCASNSTVSIKGREQPMQPEKGLADQIYAFIVRYIKTERMPPTNREIGREMHITSTGHIDYHLWKKGDSSLASARRAVELNL
jgi:hypothetical protein